MTPSSRCEKDLKLFNAFKLPIMHMLLHAFRFFNFFLLHKLHNKRLRSGEKPYSVTGTEPAPIKCCTSKTWVLKLVRS